MDKLTIEVPEHLMHMCKDYDELEDNSTIDAVSLAKCISRNVCDAVAKKRKINVGSEDKND